MKIPTSRATIASSKGSTWPGERSGARACTATIVPTPSSSAAAARNARLRRSSVRSEGFGAMIAEGIGRKTERRGSPRRPFRPSVATLRPLDALRLAFLVGRRKRRRPDVNGAGLGRGGVLHPRCPAVGRRSDGRAHDTTRGGERGAQVGGVLHRVGEIRLFGGHEVPEIRLHRSQIRLLLRVYAVRNHVWTPITDAHHYRRKVEKAKALAFHSTTFPPRMIQYFH